MEHIFVFSPSVRVEFAQYLRENPNNRRVSQPESDRWIDWIRNAAVQTSTQQESSRRHYIRKTFIWDAEEQRLLAVPKVAQAQYREVVTEDRILDVVETVHRNNGHAGWDTTWEDIRRTFYGILRADVIFLLKRCQICVHDIRKRPKSFLHTTQQVDTTASRTSYDVDLNDLLNIGHDSDTARDNSTESIDVE
jgi:hypothetical protein